MRERDHGSGSSLGPRPTYSPGRTLVGALLLLAAFAGVLLTASYPGVALPVATAGLAGALTVRAVRTRLHRRRATGRTRRVCLPATDRCIEA